MTPKAIEEHFNTTQEAVSKRAKVFAECQLLSEISTKAFSKSVWHNQFIETSGTTTVSIVIQYTELSEIETIMEMGFRQGFTSGLENLDALFDSGVIQ